MEPNARLHAADEGYIALENDILEYQQALGSIMYAMLGTRPDLAYPISSLSKFSINPSFEHAAAIHRIFRYLQKTVNVGITFGNTGNATIEAIKKAVKDSNTLGDTTSLGKGLTGILGFTDSDWAGDIDSRKSTSGYVFTLHSGAISWKSRKQNVVATSSTEAEYIASTEAVKEGLWLRRLMAEIRGSQQPANDGTPTEDLHDIDTRNEWGCLLPSEKATTSQSMNHSQIIFADNQGAIKLSENPKHHSRSKHIDVKFHFIREASQQGLIRLVYIPTTDMVADILTKPLARDKHEKHMEGMGLRERREE